MRKFFQNAGPAIRLFMVGFLFLLLQGCQHPFIEVTVGANAEGLSTLEQGRRRMAGSQKRGPAILQCHHSPDQLQGGGIRKQPGNPDGHQIQASENLSCNGAIKREMQVRLVEHCGGWESMYQYLYCRMEIVIVLAGKLNIGTFYRTDPDLGFGCL